MNLCHRWLCNSAGWAAKVEKSVLPWALEGADLGTEALEIGPGYGATTRVLTRRVPRLTVLEVDRASADRLDDAFDGRVEVVHADGSAMPLPDRRFDSVVCFTMLHHVPTPELQDRLFSEAFRVLRPGGVFAGCDALDGWGFRLIHIGDTCVPVPPHSLADRLGAAGFKVTKVSTGGAGGSNVRFRAVRP
ncbi:class I SAM-dependent methyltransferase [Streptomyces sp. MST-110588]|nr:class I SAM-dependent methyltransferase [Streptomyces sp. MST-110588]